jgi:hypothetical protein
MSLLPKQPGKNAAFTLMEPVVPRNVLDKADLVWLTDRTRPGQFRK